MVAKTTHLVTAILILNVLSSACDERTSQKDTDGSGGQLSSTSSESVGGTGVTVEEDGTGQGDPIAAGMGSAPSGTGGTEGINSASLGGAGSSEMSQAGATTAAAGFGTESSSAGHTGGVPDLSSVASGGTVITSARANGGASILTESSTSPASAGGAKASQKCSGSPSHTSCASCPASDCGSCAGCVTVNCDDYSIYSCDKSFCSESGSICTSMGCRWRVSNCTSSFGITSCEGQCSSSSSGSRICYGSMNTCESIASESLCRSTGCTWK